MYAGRPPKLARCGLSGDRLDKVMGVVRAEE